VLDFYNWSGWGLSPEAWTIIMLAVGVLLAFLINLTRGDVAYALVLLWAYVGIAIKHQGSIVSQAAWAASALLVIVTFIGWFLYRRNRGQRSEQTPVPSEAPPEMEESESV
jgi:ABC-type nickel/cobalt efflux system permease component RcnA